MFGGISGQRRDLIDPGESLYGRFEHDVNKQLGERIRASEDDAVAMWSALANVTWKRALSVEEKVVADLENQEQAVGYSFRAAGDLVAAISGRGDYLSYYCSGPYAVVAEWIEEGLAKAGWTYEA